MPRERLLITVKTYPTLSRQHGETVCTAAVRADGRVFMRGTMRRLGWMARWAARIQWKFRFAHTTPQFHLQ
jgi:hypothetical protein